MELKFEREKGNKDLNIFAQEALRQIIDLKYDKDRIIRYLKIFIQFKKTEKLAGSCSKMEKGFGLG